MATLYRAVSQRERNDYFERREFRLAKNTLEAKQFFKSRIAIKQFVERSIIQNYEPPYVHLLIIKIDEASLIDAKPEEMKLDGFDAISIDEDDLVSFNNVLSLLNRSYYDESTNDI